MSMVAMAALLMCCNTRLVCGQDIGLVAEGHYETDLVGFQSKDFAMPLPNPLAFVGKKFDFERTVEGYKADATFTYVAGPLTLGAAIEAKVEVDPGPSFLTLGADAQISTTDRVFLEWDVLQGPEPNSPGYLRLQLELDGVIEQTFSGGGDPQINTRIYLYGPQTNIDVDYSAIGTYDVNLAPVVLLPLGREGQILEGSFDVGYGIQATLNDFSVPAWLNKLVWSLKAGFLDTLSIESITLPDGRTPEEAGYTLTFESGRPSPNVVPEPGAVSLLAGTVLLAYVCRNRISSRKVV
ncbi:hypothetical protein [Aeoliella sp.]|uniref:hypothetical protein n=1 Tax=Aeoliella sp. TaxID=2795800 RepID=UPI003CCBE916